MTNPNPIHTAMPVLSRLIVLALILSALSACRYIELYRFSKQFCDFDEYISVDKNIDKTHVHFHTPLLSRELLLRYLGAQPLTASEGRDSFTIRSETNTNKTFSFQLNYHLLDTNPLLASAELDAALSRLFTQEFVIALLKSFCTEDYDIEDDFVHLRFQLDTIDHTALPSQADLASVLGHNKDGYNYRYEFVENDLSVSPDTNKTVAFQFGFDADNQLQQLSIQYYRYDYHLDLHTGQGRLIVKR